ncbi:zf-HC2 domain-containing protein [Marinobacter mobilis]|uniref:Putative zinc-finger n=1 Tax=Marinobacter mobilis TaxID=488533 RepID=A0A1H3CB37_9GAMM|nr:zf-HC2 domain-containing protein [Marinobacter mobilis]SDW73531.1 Putative zinc-finger [Marinobacter mobilis]SDX51250.1 Putative zinc-finger [Marinobacter mobilis]
MLMCRDLATIASDYLDGELGATDRLSVKVHLMMCRNCRSFIGNLRNSAALIRAHSSQTPDPDYLRRLDENIAKALAGKDRDDPGE